MGTGRPGLNQSLARINVSCSRTQHSALVKLEPVAPPSRVKLSATEPLKVRSPILLLQCEGQALPNAREGVYSIQSIKTCSRSRSYTIFWCSTKLSMEFMLFINVKKCWHLNSYLKSEFLHVNKKTFTFKLTF